MLNTSWLKRLEEDYSVRDVLIQTSGVWFEICSTIAKFLIKWKITQKRKRIRKKTKIINYVKNSYWSLNHCVELKKTVRLQNPVVQYKYGAKSKKKKKKRFCVDLEVIDSRITIQTFWAIDGDQNWIITKDHHRLTKLYGSRCILLANSTHIQDITYLTRNTL